MNNLGLEVHEFVVVRFVRSGLAKELCESGLYPWNEHQICYENVEGTCESACRFAGEYKSVDRSEMHCGKGSCVVVVFESDDGDETERETEKCFVAGFGSGDHAMMVSGNRRMFVLG